MAIVKRLRVFAGPNGSGKSTLTERLKNKIKLGVYLNSDEILEILEKRGFIHLDEYHLKLTQFDLEHHIKRNSGITSKISSNRISRLYI